MLYEVITAPIRTSDGRLAGRLRIGFPDSILEERTAKVFQRSLLTLGIAFVVVFTLIVLFVKRDLIGPINRLCTVAKEIASGNFRVSVPHLPTSDFNELGVALHVITSYSIHYTKLYE